MNKVYWMAWALVALCSLGEAKAQQTCALQDCIRMALERNIGLQMQKAEIERSVTLQRTAVDLEKTGVSFSQDLTGGGSMDNSWNVSQGFSLPTVYRAKRKALEADTKVLRAGMKLSRHELVKEVTTAYYGLLHAKEVIRVHRSQDSIYARFVKLASAREKAGEAGKLERMNAERLWQENKLTLYQAEKDFQEAQLVLQKWTSSETEIFPAEDRLRPLDASSALVKPVFEDSPWAEVIEEETKSGEKRLKAEQKGFLPDFSVGLTGQMVIKGFNPYKVDRSRFDKGNFLGFEIGVSVPLFFGAQKARVKAAKQEILIGQLKARQEAYRLKKEYEIALNEYVRARKSLDYYEDKANKEGNEMERISEVSYEKGDIGYVEYIQNLQTVADVELRYADAINAYNQAVITLNYLQGK